MQGAQASPLQLPYCEFARKILPTFNLAIQAAVNGMGVTLAWHSLVADDVKAGRLALVLDQSIPTSLGFHLVMPEKHAALEKVVAFRAWLFDQVAQQKAVLPNEFIQQPQRKKIAVA